MRKKVRKSLAFLLALALVVSVMSGLGLSVSADDAQNEPVVTETEGEPAEEKLKAEENTSAEGGKEETADPDAETVQEEKKDVKKAEGEGSGDESPVKDTTADPNGEQKDEPQAEPAAEEPAEPQEEPAASYLSTLSVEELYAYLTKLDDNNFAAAWQELTDSQKADYNAYVLKMAFGDNKATTSYEGGAAAASMTNVAGLVSNLAASQKALRNSPARAARAAAASTTLKTEAQDPDDGLYMSKSISKTKQNATDTRYKIRLESYATGQTTTSTVTKSVPCDIVLVLDQSGSMAYDMKKVEYTDKAFDDSQTNADVYEKYSDKLFVLVNDSEGKPKHVPITVERKTIGSNYTKKVQTNSTWNDRGTDITQYYYLSDSGYKKLSKVNKRLDIVSYTYIYTYTYTCEDGTKFESKGKNENVTLYQKNDTYSYTYSYKETEEGVPAPVTIEGNDSRIPTSTDNPDFFDGTTDRKLYYSSAISQGNEARLDALQRAARNFVSSIEDDADKNGVKHNVAIVGFSSDGYDNTEVLTGVDITRGYEYINKRYTGGYGDPYYYPTGYAENGVQYNDPKYNSDVKRNALQSATTETGKNSISNAIDALTAHGGTQTQDGVKMANDILAEQSEERLNEYKTGKRNKIVVVFTDGEPDEYNGGAVDAAKTLKDGGATVYTIGIFDKANANDMQSNSNKFMHYVSSNYPNATSWYYPGTKVNDGYYLTAANSADLNSIFQKISQSISESSSKVKLTETTQTIDKMSAEFKLPDNIQKKDVKVYRVPCTSFVEDTPVFDDSKKTELDGATITFGEDTVSVSGFNYSEDYVNKDAAGEGKGYKLLIEFPVEYKNEAWFGGNDIASNDIGSGIYDDKGDCHGTFEVPKVNRAIDYEIAAKNQTIYVTNPANLKELLGYAEKDSKTYKPDGKNNKYVDIVYTLKKGDTIVGTYKISKGESEGIWQADGAKWNPADLTDCTTYTWTCTVTPHDSDGKSLGVAGTGNTAAERTECDSANGTVHVLYPTAKAEDKTIYWGEEAKAADLVKQDSWKEKNSHGTIPAVSGTKPTVTVTPDFVAGDKNDYPAKDGAYNVKIEVGTGKNVTETVRSMEGGITTQEESHTNCDDHKDVDDKTYDFCIHVKVKKLTVEKIVGGNMGDTNQGFTFTGKTIYDDSKNEVKNKFTLKNGQDVTFKLKVGDDVSITEDSVAGYETSYKVGDDSEVKHNTYNYGKVEANNPDAVTVTYTNTKTINPPNGIITTIAPYAIMVVLAAGAGVYFVYSRRRRNH